MTLSFEIIIFITSMLFGIVLYWRESKGNKIYRFFNTLLYSKELQMKPDCKKGFLYQQSFLMRLVYISILFLIAIIILRFLIPIDLATVSLFASIIFGTLLGTYLAHFVFKSSEVIDEKGDSIVDAVKDTVEKGKEFIQDLDSKEEEPLAEDIESETDKKSARERLKDKGLM